MDLTVGNALRVLDRLVTGGLVELDREEPQFRDASEQAFHIRTALVDAPRHGYGIVGEVAALSDGQCCGAASGSTAAAGFLTAQRAAQRGARLQPVEVGLDEPEVARLVGHDEPFR